MTELYLVRHGEAEGNITNRTHGITNTDLTPRGREQLTFLRRRFEPVPVDAVYASPLLRAQKTALAIAAPKGLAVRTDPELREQSMGVFEDASWHELLARFPQETERWLADSEGYCLPGGESRIEAGRRMERAVTRIVRAEQGRRVAAVSHAIAIRSFLARLGIEAGYGDNTAVTKLVYDDGLFRPVYVNDSSHLPDGRPNRLERARFSREYMEDYSLCFEPLFEPDDVPESGVITGTSRGRPVGSVTYRVRGRALYILDMCIPEGERGKGYGTQLLGEAVYRGRRLSAKEVRWDAALTPAAITLLEKNDFQRRPGGLWSKPIRPLF